MMRKLGKAQKMGITFAVLCCVLLASVFFADHKNLFVHVTDVLNVLTGAETETTVDSMIVMNTEDAQQTDDYYAFGVYAPSTATYTIGVTAENGKMRINTGEATVVDGTEVSVSLTEGTNVLYFVDCVNPSIQWDSEECDLEPVNKVCMPLSGDVNQSGNRTAEDLVRIKKEAKAVGTGNIERTEIADIDGNDSVTDEDARLLRTLIVGNPEYEAAEHCALIVDAYIEETGTLYDTLADAVEAASAISTTDSKSVTVTVLNPTDVKLVRDAEYLANYNKTISIPVTDGAQIELIDDGWRRSITRGSTENFKMFAIGENASLTLTGSSESDESSSLIVDGGAKANGGNHVVDVGNTLGAETAKLTMNAGVWITNNENNGATSSGGALAVKGTFNMNGGVISGNIAKGTGGAINLLSGSVMNMAGGTITENRTESETSGAGAVNISNGAALVMTGGTISGNIASESVGNNSVRMGGVDSVLKMEGAAYIDNVCLNASTTTPYIELTGKLTTEDEITLFFVQPLNKTDLVVKRSILYKENDALFQLSERMLPCTLEAEELSGGLCLKSSTEGMEKIKASLVYSNYNFDDNTWAVQGVCTDGTYLYAAIEQEETVGVTFNGCKILKVKLGTWGEATTSAVLPTDHSNEMTYNPTTGKIYITHCMSSGEFTDTTGITEETGPYAISVVDPSSLTVEEVITLSDATAYTGTTGIYAVAYDSTQEYYVAGCTGFRFGFLDDTLTEVAMPSTGMAGFSGYTSYTKQGVYANDTTIYTNNWNDKDKMNLITMYDWSGNYNGTKYVVDQNGNAFAQESESMFEYNGDMYMACIPTDHIGVDIYKLEGVGKATSTIDVMNADGTLAGGYTNLADAIAKANELETATIVLKDDVTIGATQTITGNVTITDDGTKRTLLRSTGCNAEMFNVAGGAELTFTSSTKDDNNPMLVIDGNKANVETVGYAPVVDMDQTNGILNITPGVIIQNNMSHHAGGVIFAGLNGTAAKSGGQATINITGGLFTENEISYTNNQWLFGGVIYIESGCTLNISNATFENTKMAQNCTGGMTYGGVIAVRTNASHLYDDTNVIIENCIFENTTVTQKGSGNGGGVLYIGAGNPNSVQITNCEFTNNATEGFGGAIYMSNTTAALDLSGCRFSNNTDANGTNDIYMVASTKVNVSGNTQANVTCAGTEQIYIAETLGTESVIKVSVSEAAAGDTVATFASEEIMNACIANENLVLTNREYILSYEETSDSEYIATLVDAVAEVGDSRYASLAEAIAVASTIESDAENPVVITLISDTVAINSVTTIPTGTFVKITDDGTPRTIKRQGFTGQMFVVESGAGLTFTATSEDNATPSLTIDGNKTEAGASNAMISLGVGSGALTINGAVQFTNANINQDGGIIRTEDGSTSAVTINGGVFDNNEASISDDLCGGLIRVGGSAVVTISNAVFENNTIASATGALKGGIIYVDGGTVNIVGSSFNNNAVTTKKTGNGGVIGVYGGRLHVGKYDDANGETIEGTCYFTNNSFTSTVTVKKYAYGGVFGIGGGTAKVCNSEVTGNTAELGGAVNESTAGSLIVGNCTFENNIANYKADTKDLRVSGTVIFEGKVNTTIYRSSTKSLQVNGTLDVGSKITVTMQTWTVGNTIVTFDSEVGMNACIANENLVLTDSAYTLVYETTSESNYIAKLNAVE